MAVGPVSAATSKTLLAQGASNTATVTGTITANGAPLPAVDVSLTGPATYHAVTDSSGTFTIQNVAPGIYSISLVHGGYISQQSTFALVAGQVQAVNVALQPASFSTLQTIAHVRAVGPGVFNTSVASINTINATQVETQAAFTAFQLFDEVPGVNINLPSADGNGADKGAVSYVGIRGSLPYENSTLIDGHPLETGDFGDYTLSYAFLPVFMSELEVTKGPGQMAPVINNDIGGTVNFVTFDPTLTFTPDYFFGFDNFGGTYGLLGVSDTLFDGRLGIVVRIGTRNEPCACNGQQLWSGYETDDGIIFNPGTSKADEGYYQDAEGLIPGTMSEQYNRFNLVQCCETVEGYNDNTGELVKLRYRFSAASFLTVSYIGSDQISDETGTIAETWPADFAPQGPYTGPLPNGTGQFIMSNEYDTPDTLTNVEPIFEADFTTAIGQDTFKARWYHASIDRLVSQCDCNGPSDAVDQDLTVYGYNDNYSTPYPTYNGVTVPTALYEWYVEHEFDFLQGFEGEFDMPYGNGSVLSAAWSGTADNAQYYYEETTQPGVCEVCTYNTPLSAGLTHAPVTYIPNGSSQITNTYSITDTDRLSSDLVFDAGLYEDFYRNNFATECYTGGVAGICSSDELLPNGSNAVWTTQTPRHFDDRWGLEWQPDPDTSVRFTAGSSIAPPWLDILSYQEGAVTTEGTGSAEYAEQSIPNPNLQPETAFGYDVGLDQRIIDPDTFLKVDLYTTNIYNHFLEQYFTSPDCYDTTTHAVATCPTTVATPYVNIEDEEWTNIANTRTQGIEVTLQRVPTFGWGYNLNASLERAYAYDLPSNFYCTHIAAIGGVVPQCTPAYYNTNLAILPGENFTANGIETGQNGISSTGYAVPYFMGYGSVNYTFPSGLFVQFGEQLTGKNNWANEPPFWTGTASLRIPLSSSLAIQISGWNVFNTLSGDFPVLGGGVPVPLACTPESDRSPDSICNHEGSGSTLVTFYGEPAVGATEGNVLGPAQWTFLITKNFGALPATSHQTVYPQ